MRLNIYIYICLISYLYIYNTNTFFKSLLSCKVRHWKYFSRVHFLVARVVPFQTVSVKPREVIKVTNRATKATALFPVARWWGELDRSPDPPTPFPPFPVPAFTPPTPLSAYVFRVPKAGGAKLGNTRRPPPPEVIADPPPGKIFETSPSLMSSAEPYTSTFSSSSKWVE